MPRIPAELGYGAPSAGIAGPASVPISARGINDLATSVTRAYGRQQIRKQDEADFADRLGAARAKSVLLSAQAEMQEEFREDDDFGTFLPRYEKKMEEVRSKALDLVADPKDREMLAVNLDNAVLQGRSRVSALAWDRKKGAARAELNDGVDTLISGALEVNDPAYRQQVISNIGELIDANLEDGYLTAEEAQQAKKQAGESYATKMLGSMSPEEQLAALKDSKSVVSILDKDDRVEYERRAKAAIKTQRDAARTAENRYRDDLYAQAENMIASDLGQSGAQVVGNELWMKLEPSERRKLEDYADRLANNNDDTDYAVWNEIRTMQAEDRTAFKDVELSRYADGLSQSDLQKFRTEQLELKNGDESKLNTIRNASQIVDATMRGIGLSWGSSANETQNQQANLFRVRMDEMVYGYRQAHGGQEPDHKWITDTARDLAQEVVVERSFLDADNIVADLLVTDKVQHVYEMADDIPSDHFSDIVAELRARNIEPTEDAIRFYYERGQSGGD